jgi:hypothetical protein
LWDEESKCWECVLPDEKLYLYNCSPSHKFISTQRNYALSIIRNDTYATYEIFDSLHEAQKYLCVKYNKEVRYRDPNEE